MVGGRWFRGRNLACWGPRNPTSSRRLERKRGGRGGWRILRGFVRGKLFLKTPGGPDWPVSRVFIPPGPRGATRGGYAGPTRPERHCGPPTRGGGLAGRHPRLERKNLACMGSKGVTRRPFVVGGKVGLGPGFTRGRGIFLGPCRRRGGHPPVSEGGRRSKRARPDPGWAWPSPPFLPDPRLVGTVRLKGRLQRVGKSCVRTD